LYRLNPRPKSINVTYTTPFSVTSAGEYRFALETYAGSGTLTIDGLRRDASAHTTVPLSAGLHTLEVRAEFAPMALEPVIRLVWSGPDTGNRQELMPFYRLAPIDPGCAAAAGQTPFADNPPAPHSYVTDWLALGPFDNPNGTAVQQDFIDVAQLSANPQGTPTAERLWTPIPPRGDAFVDLDSFYAPTAPHHNPQYVCAYAATTVTSGAARAAFLELAGSGDPLRVWLNGAELTPLPLKAGYEPQRRMVELRAGANLLVIKSCEDIGAWYFVARFTDGARNDMPDLHAAAALPTQPIAPPSAASGETVQLLDGMDAVISAPHSSPKYGDYRGGGPSSWAYVEDAQHEVSWRTPPVPERKPTIFAVVASTSPENGEGELYVNGRDAVAFRIGTQGVGGQWSDNGYRVSFVSKGFVEGNSGILLVSVPPEVLTPGEPVYLRVALTGGTPRAWFMVKGYQDAVAHEALTPRVAGGLLHSAWEPAS